MDSRELLEAARRLKPRLVEDRRAIHQQPELAYQEVKTAARVAERLTELGIEHRTGIAETGVIGIIEGTRPGRTVILRGDMDALPILEETPVPFASQNPGVMHACGHDTHTAMLLGAAQLLNERRDLLAGTVKLMFQPAEEGGGGAKRMLDEGLLEAPAVDAAFMIHVHPDLPMGKVGFRAGPSMAGMCRFEIEVRGKGGHAARPHMAVDPVVISAHVVTALQTLVSRELDPTAMGLITAIPTVFSHVLFRAWVINFELKMQSAAKKLLALIQSKQAAGTLTAKGGAAAKPGIDPASVSPRR